MNRKLLSTCVALVAFAAFAVVPAIASASPELQTSGGAKVEPGTSIKGESSNLKFSTGFGNVECTHNTLIGSLTTNSGTTIAGDITEAIFTGETPESHCKTTINGLNGKPLTAKVIPTNLPWCLHSEKAGQWTLRGGTCNEAAKPLVFDLEMTEGTNVVATCKYERSSVTGTNNTKSSPLVLTVGASQTFTRVSGGFLCPSSGTLSGSFTVKTSAGGELKVV